MENSYRYYRDTFNVYNVHNPIHIADNARRLECPLDEISYFQFENYLQVLKKRIRNANNPIAQITKMLEEKDATQNFPVKARLGLKN